MLAAAPVFFDRATAVAGPRALHDLVRRMVLKEVLGGLAGRGIPVMPLKGALLAYWVYDDPADRRVSDVDLLVPEAVFDEAIEALSAQGWHPDLPVQTHERTLRAREVDLTVDLHRTLFPKGRFRLSTQDLFARGRRNTELYGAPVVLPDPYDACAHLVGHATCAHQLPLDPRAVADLERLSLRFSLDARHCAAHLESTGLARAARYTLAACGPTSIFARRVLGHLRPDPFGAFLAATQQALNLRFPVESIPARVAGHLTNVSLCNAAEAAFDAIAERFRFRNGSTGIQRE
jgi:hypothetical protein